MEVQTPDQVMFAGVLFILFIMAICIFFYAVCCRRPPDEGDDKK